MVIENIVAIIISIRNLFETILLQVEPSSKKKCKFVKYKLNRSYYVLRKIQKFSNK